jgi:ribokinase
MPAECGDLLALTDIVRADAREAQKPTGVQVIDAASFGRVGRDLLGRGPSLVAYAP